MKPDRSSPSRFAAPAPLRWLVALLVSHTVLLSGCVSLRPVALPRPGQPAAALAVKVGDHVQVRTRAGERHEFTITAIEPDALVGPDRRVPFDEISELQVKRLDKVRTGGAVVGTAVGLVLVAAIAVAASGGFAFMPPGP